MSKAFVKLFLFLLVFPPEVATAQPKPPSPNEPLPQPVVIPVTSDAPEPIVSLQPPITPLKGTDQIQLQLVNCNRGLDCAIASLLLPQSTRIDRLQLQFDNPASSPAQILNSATVVQGNFTRYQLTDAFSVPSGTQTLDANQIVNLPLTLNRSAMPPDQYSGAIYLTLSNQTNRLALPVNLSVRSGPLLPLLVLLLGVILGRLFKYMQEQGGPQAETRKRLYQLEADLKDAHPDDQRLLNEMVLNVRKLVYRQQLDAANMQITALRSRLDVLTQIRSIETRLNDKKKNEYVPIEAFEEINQVRAEIEQGLDTKAKETLDQLIETLDSVAARGGKDDSAEIESSLRGASTSLDRNARSLAIAPPQPKRLDQLQRFFIDLSGLSDLVRTEATYWFVRPLLYTALLIGLAIVGLNTLYVEKGETFGARPLSDYLGLLLWGLSADVASRSLSSLQGQRESGYANHS